jgi:hypothetical protein
MERELKCQWSDHIALRLPRLRHWYHLCHSYREPLEDVYFAVSSTVLFPSTIVVAKKLLYHILCQDLGRIPKRHHMLGVCVTPYEKRKGIMLIA